MKKLKQLLTNKKLFFAVLLSLVVLFCLQIIAGYFFIRISSFQSTESSLHAYVNRMKNDLIYTGNSWNMTKYNADPLSPYPNSPGSFPLYIITTDGYVIERNRPINGLLDASDFNHMRTYSNAPQTITSPTGEHWRVFSRLIYANGNPGGVVGVAYYNPQQSLLSEIDSKLSQTLDYIAANINYENNEIVLSDFDIRNIPHYEISFEIVDKYNRIILNNGRSPSYIDPSYVSKELSAIGKRIVQDTKTGERFLTESSIIYDASNNPISLIVSAKSVASIYSLLQEYLISSILLSLLLLLPSAMTIMYLFKRYSGVKEETPAEEVRVPEAIWFDKEESRIHIDDQFLAIPYASNQYYLVEALFSNPKKRWEQDELLEKYGESADSVNARKIYDAMLAVNKKLDMKLFFYRDKTFRINPDLSSKIKQN